MPDARPPRVFRVTGAVWLLGISTVASIGLLIEATVRSGPGEMLLLAPWLLLVLWAIYVVGIASDVRADRSGVRVQNLLRRTWVPWSRVERVAMRWQLEFRLDRGAVVRCFGGPARSRPRRIGPGRTREDENDEVLDGVAKLQRLKSEAEHATGADVTRSWDWGATFALVALTAWAVVAVLLTR